jgi:hypothetical protein
MYCNDITSLIFKTPLVNTVQTVASCEGWISRNFRPRWKETGGFRIMPLLCPLKKNCIKYNDKINSLQRCDITWNCRTLHRVVRVCPNITSKFHTISIFKCLSKQNNDWDKTCRYMPVIFYYSELHLSKCSSSWVSSIKQNMNLNFQPSTMVVFLVCRKCGLIESCSFFEVLSAYKISLSDINCC